MHIPHTRPRIRPHARNSQLVPWWAPFPPPPPIPIPPRTSAPSANPCSCSSYIINPLTHQPVGGSTPQRHGLPLPLGAPREAAASRLSAVRPPSVQSLALLYGVLDHQGAVPNSAAAARQVRC